MSVHPNPRLWENICVDAIEVYLFVNQGGRDFADENARSWKNLHIELSKRRRNLGHHDIAMNGYMFRTVSFFDYLKPIETFSRSNTRYLPVFEGSRLCGKVCFLALCSRFIWRKLLADALICYVRRLILLWTGQPIYSKYVHSYGRTLANTLMSVSTNASQETLKVLSISSGALYPDDLILWFEKNEVSLGIDHQRPQPIHNMA